jgi:hypothetical protein
MRIFAMGTLVECQSSTKLVVRRSREAHSQGHRRWLFIHGRKRQRGTVSRVTSKSLVKLKEPSRQQIEDMKFGLHRHTEEVCGYLVRWQLGIIREIQN